MTAIVNLTPHAIALADSEGNIVETFPPSGQVARLSTTAEVVGSIHGAPLSRTVYGPIQGLPDLEPDIYYLVSALVGQAARRPDVIAPDTGPTAVRRDGQIVAVRGFVAFT